MYICTFVRECACQTNRTVAQHLLAGAALRQTQQQQKAFARQENTRRWTDDDDAYDDDDYYNDSLAMMITTIDEDAMMLLVFIFYLSELAELGGSNSFFVVADIFVLKILLYSTDHHNYWCRWADWSAVRPVRSTRCCFSFILRVYTAVVVATSSKKKRNKLTAPRRVQRTNSTTSNLLALLRLLVGYKK